MVIIAVRGDADTGKTLSIRRAFEILLHENPDASYTHFRGWKEVSTTITINGVRIGIESKGDLEKFLKKAFGEFADTCKIIVCACHKSGKTMRAVVDFASSHGHSVIWLEKSASARADAQDADNEAMAVRIVAAVQAELSHDT
jgi:hypothetical protein